MQDLAKLRPGAGSAIGAALLAILLSACRDPCCVKSELFSVDVEQGSRRTSAGDRIPYTLFTPLPDQTMAAPPYPAVVLSHGFARDRRFHHSTGCALAQRGIVVLTPNLASLLGGERAQLRNIENLADHVRWLRSRAADDSDRLFGLLDPKLIGLVGHSAGGAISFEAAIELANAGEAVSALMLLDGVPWSRTVERAAELREVAFASLRSEPAACNADGAILGLLSGLSFITEDILIVGGSHCDPEYPTDFVCEFACGRSHEEARNAYQGLIYAFLQEALSAPEIGALVRFDALVEQLVTEGRAVRASNAP